MFIETESGLSQTANACDFAPSEFEPVEQWQVGPDHASVLFSGTRIPIEMAYGEFDLRVLATSDGHAWVTTKRHRLDRTPSRLLRVDAEGSVQEHGQWREIRGLVERDGRLTVVGHEGIFEHNGHGWEQVNDAEIECVLDRGEDWLLCGRTILGFGVAQSLDGGRTLSPLFEADDLTQPTACGEERATCVAEWDDVVIDLALDPALLGARPEFEMSGCAVHTGHCCWWILLLLRRKNA